LTLTAVIAILILTGLSAAEWTGSADADSWDLPALNANIGEGGQLAAELQNRFDGVTRRIVLKEAVAADLSKGRFGLMGAAARFRALNARGNSNAAIVRAMFPDMSDDERVCWNVIAFVEGATVAGETVGCRLRLELLILKAAGRLYIPELPPSAEDELLKRTTGPSKDRG
jgi:hypothetical protein